MYRLIFAFIIFTSSCYNKKDSMVTVSRETEIGFAIANETISNANNLIYKELSKKLSIPISAYKTEIWNPIALNIKKESDSTYNYLEALISDLIKEATPINGNKADLQEDNLDAVKRIFLNNKKGDELQNKLSEYKAKVFGINEEIRNQFAEKSILNGLTNRKNFSNFFFDKIPAITAITLLRKFENDIKVNENELINFCNAKTISYTDSYEVFKAIVGQSSNYIKAGDELEITAGIGAFTLNAKPKITINGKTINVSTLDGVAIYKFKTPNKLGKYIVPVKIEYTEPDGRIQFKDYKIENTVIQ